MSENNSDLPDHASQSATDARDTNIIVVDCVCGKMERKAARPEIMRHVPESWRIAARQIRSAQKRQEPPTNGQNE